MALAVYQRTIVDDDGNILPGASVEVRTDPANTLATIYSDRDGSTPITNPTVADVNGKVTFFAVGGAYKITATFGELNIIDRYQAIGTMAEYDVDVLDAVIDQSTTGFNVMEYGAVGDGVTDDTAAFQAAIDAMKASYSGFDVLGGPIILPKPPASYLITGSLNFQDIPGIGGWGVVGLGMPVVQFKATGKICFDCFGSLYGRFQDFTIHGDSTNIGEIGIAFGKKSGASRGSHYVSNVVVRGSWATSCLYVGGSEVNYFIKSRFVNSKATGSGHCLIVDGMAHWTPTSDFASPTMTADTAYSCIENHFVSCEFRRSGYIPIFLACPTQLEFNKCYAFGDGTTAIEFLVPGAAETMSIVGDYIFDLHVEPVPTSLSNQITFSRTVASGPLSIDGVKIAENGQFPTSLLDRGTNVSRLTINGDINWRSVGGSRALYTDSEIVVRGRVNNTLLPNPPAFFDKFSEYGVDQGDNIGFVVDPSDYLCYPGTGQIVYDRSSNAVEFTLGNTSGSSTDDPTFIGSAGALDGSCYFACDGGDFIRATANTTAIQNMHKDNALFRLGGWFWIGSTNNQSFFDTLSSGAGTGIRFRVIASTRLSFLVLNASGSVFGYTSTVVGITPARWNYITLNVDEAAGTGFFTVNGLNETFACTYSSPAAGDATSLLRVGAMGNGTDFLTSGSRIGPFWLDRARTSDENFALYETQRHRFGL